MKIRFTILISALLIISLSFGCAPHVVKKEPPYKAIALGRVAAEELVTTAIRMNRDGLLSDADLQRVRTTYESARKANDIVINIFITSLNLDIDPRTVPEYNKALDSYVKLMQNLQNLGLELKIIKEEGCAR